MPIPQRKTWGVYQWKSYLIGSKKAGGLSDGGTARNRLKSHGISEWSCGSLPHPTKSAVVVDENEGKSGG